jgi:hypothetical protein
MDKKSEFEKATNEKELDMFSLFIRIIQFFKTHTPIVLLTIIAGALVYFLLSMMPGRVYKSAYIIATSGLPNEEVIEISNSLAFCIKNDASKIVADKLNISPESASNIRTISFEPILSTNNMSGRLFKITVQFNDLSPDQSGGQIIFLNNLKNGLAKYINNIPYVKERYEFLMTSKKNFLLDINNQINKIDSIYSYQLQNMEKYKSTIIDYENKKSLAAELIQLREKQIELDSSCLFDKPITYLQEFNVWTVQEPFASRKARILFSILPLIILIIYPIFKNI